MPQGKLYFLRFIYQELPDKDGIGEPEFQKAMIRRKKSLPTLDIARKFLDLEAMHLKLRKQILDQATKSISRFPPELRDDLAMLYTAYILRLSPALPKFLSIEEFMEEIRRKETGYHG